MDHGRWFVARKNGNGEGSRPRERADGRWEARYWVGGKRRSVYGSTRKEAADKLAKAIANNEEPRATFAATNITVWEFFAQYDDAVRDTMKRRSLETYRDIARLHLLPAFGSKKLKDLTRKHVQQMYSQKRDTGLSAARVRRIHGVLSSALNHAVRWRLLDHNVCREVSPPRVPPPEIRPLSLDEAKRFLTAAEGERYEALYVLGLTSGMRLGELGGVFWSDVDLTRRVLHIQRSLITGHGRQTLESPKTPGSRRSIVLTAKAVDTLLLHRERQQVGGYPVEGDALL